MSKLEAGKYFCSVASQRLGKSGNGNWTVYLTLNVLLHEVTPGEDAVPVETEEFDNKCTYYGPLTKKSVSFVKRELESETIGFKGDHPADIHIAEGNSNCVGNEGWWTLSYDPPKKEGDTPFEKWRPVMARASAGPAVELSESDLAEVNALHGEAWASEAGATTATKGEWNEL